MKSAFSLYSFSTRILVGIVVLIILTSLSAGVPAFWLTQTQLERQAWNQVENAQRATKSLLAAEQIQLTNQLILLTQRPTLKDLIHNGSRAELEAYLQDFQKQIGLDILLFCDPNKRFLAGDPNDLNCATEPIQGFVQLTNEPALFAQQPVWDDQTEEELGLAVAGMRLDSKFLAKIVASTGAQQSILQADGTRLSSSFAEIFSQAGQLNGLKSLSIQGSDYFAAYSRLENQGDGTFLISEVALNVDNLVATERRAFTVLAISTGIIVLLGTIISIGFVRQVSAPLQKLTATAEKISQGDLVAAIPLFSQPVEIRTLAEALHRSQTSMLDALQERSEVGERLNTILQSIVEGVVTCDLSGRVTFWSAGAHRLLGWSPVEALDTYIDELFQLTESDDPPFSEKIPTNGQKIQIKVNTREGVPVVLALTGAELEVPGSEAPQAVLVFRDVTEEEAARQIRSYFLANISHEFRTPLSTLNASMELLLDENELYNLTEIRELLRPMYVSLLSLQTLIDNLLESSSIEAGQFNLRKQKFLVHDAIEYACNIARPLLERREQPISLRDTYALIEILADPARLTQVLVNLLFNASKYSPIGQPITLLVERRQSVIWFGVADRGPGIPATEREKIFRSFVRLDGADREQYGIGLGLYVVKTVVEAHGGKVGVKDRTGGGSLFWFEIPLPD